MGPFLTFLVSELQRGYLYKNGVEFHQEVNGADLNLFWGHHLNYEKQWRHLTVNNGTMSDSGAI